MKNPAVAYRHMLSQIMRILKLFLAKLAIEFDNFRRFLLQRSAFIQMNLAIMTQHITSRWICFITLWTFDGLIGFVAFHVMPECIACLVHRATNYTQIWAIVMD